MCKFLAQAFYVVRPDLRSSGTFKEAYMDQYDLRDKLNNALFKSGYLFDENMESAYEELCKAEFFNENEDNIDTISAFEETFIHGMIMFRHNVKLSRSSVNVVSMLKNGQIVITPYGRANLDFNRRDKDNKTWKDRTDAAIREINNIKNNIYTQVLTVMGILLTISAFINVGANIFKNREYFKLSFWEQLSSVAALYIPLLIILLAILVIMFLVMIITNIINRSK
jgi:hypothetical protein